MSRILSISSYPTCIQSKRSCQNPNHLFHGILSVDSADSSRGSYISGRCICSFFKVLKGAWVSCLRHLVYISYFCLFSLSLNFLEIVLCNCCKWLWLMKVDHKISFKPGFH